MGVPCFCLSFAIRKTILTPATKYLFLISLAPALGMRSARPSISFLHYLSPVNLFKTPVILPYRGSWHLLQGKARTYRLFDFLQDFRISVQGESMGVGSDWGWALGMIFLVVWAKGSGSYGVRSWVGRLIGETTSFSSFGKENSYFLMLFGSGGIDAFPMIIVPSEGRWKLLARLRVKGLSLSLAQACGAVLSRYILGAISQRFCMDQLCGVCGEDILYGIFWRGGGGGGGGNLRLLRKAMLSQDRRHLVVIIIIIIERERGRTVWVFVCWGKVRKVEIFLNIRS